MSKIKQLITIIIIWLLLGIGLLCTYRLWDWQVLLGVATWVLAAGVAFAFIQIREARRSTNAQIAVELFRELRSEESKNTLRAIYSLRHCDARNTGVTDESEKQPPKEEDAEVLSKTDKQHIENLLNKFNMLGGLVNRGIIDKSLAIEIFAGPPALRCWFQLGNYVRKKQVRRGFFCENFEDFARVSLDYFNKAHWYIKFYEDEENEEDKGVDLVQLLLDNKIKDEMGEAFCPRTLQDIRRNRKGKNKR